MRFALPTLILTGLVVVLVSNCGKQGPTAPIVLRDTLQYVETPTEDFEAETAAYFLSGTRLAPQYLYDKIHAELALIRLQHDSVPGVSVSYRPYARHSYLFLLFDSVITDSIRSGEYDGWDSLNSLYKLDSFVISRGYVKMNFEGVQNPLVLFDSYRNLPGLWRISTSGSFGDWPVLVMRKDSEDIKYFFREAWGDCPAGCICSRFSYFTVSDSQATFHGSFTNPLCGGPNIPPVWADSAWQAYYSYAQYLAWSHDTLRPPVYPCDTLSLDLPEVHTWEGNEEAKLVALVLSGSLNPPQVLHDRVVTDLALIRSSRPDSVRPVDSIEFDPLWTPRTFRGMWNPDLMNDKSGSSYWPFKCLGEHFGIYGVQSGSGGWFLVHNAGIGSPLHPCAMIEAYKIVPAITRMKTTLSPDIKSNVYVAMNNDTIHYYFRHAYGQLLTSPEWHYENEDFYYFESISGQVTFIGKYTPDLDLRPTWFTDYETARLKKNEQPCEWVRPD